MRKKMLSVAEAPIRKKKRVKALPIVSENSVTEVRSRAIFVKAISPWMMTDVRHDFGIDGFVEITRRRKDGEDFEATGKRFAVQLKASGLARVPGTKKEIRIRPEHVRYWRESTEPVLLVFCHVPSSKFLIRWIDDALIQELTQRNPSWLVEDTVGISVSECNLTDLGERLEIENFVRTYRGSAMRLLEPGTYGKLHKQVTLAADAMLTLAERAAFDAVGTRLRSLHRNLQTNTYTVAITGPARAGKSTLLNTLLGVSVSPVGLLPTTAVWLIVVGSDKNEAEIFFEDGSKETGDASEGFIEKYATQEANPDNTKRVSKINIRLINEFLERGVAYVDAPGLYDPSQYIRDITAKALDSAHAILYVIDVSPMANGGFSLADHQIKDMLRLSANQKHLFLILNKVDVLSDDQRAQATKYVEQELNKYQVLEKLAHPPIFMSAQSAWHWKESGGKGVAPQQALEEALWTFLLKNNATGVNRLFHAASEIKRAARDFLVLLEARRLNAAEALELQKALDGCKIRQAELFGQIQDKITRERQLVREEIATSRNVLLEGLVEWLAGIPQDKPLPTSDVIQSYVQKSLMDSANKTWLGLEGRTRNFAGLISVEVEKALQQNKIVSGLTGSMRFHLPPVPQLDLSKTESFGEAWTGFGFGALAFFVSFGAGLFFAVGGLIAALFLSSEVRRKRQVASIARNTNVTLEPIYETLLFQFDEKIGLYARSLGDNVTDRIGLFVAEAEKQMADLGRPLTANEQEQIQKAESSIQEIVPVLSEVESQLSVSGRVTTE